MLGVHKRSHAKKRRMLFAENNIMHGSRIELKRSLTMAGTIGATLIADLRHTNDFLNQQRNILSEAAFGETLAGQTKMFETRMKAAQGRIGPDQAREISELISGGPWTAPLKERLGAALNQTLLTMEGSNVQGSPPRRAPQECFNTSVVQCLNLHIHVYIYRYHIYTLI